MPTSPRVAVFPRMAHAIDRDEHPPMSSYGWRLLAEGDSWFSVSALNGKGSNLINALKLYPSATVVNCAYPGDTLMRMAQMVDDPYFDRLLRHPNFQRFFEGIFLSAGGNDVIDAAQVPQSIDGQVVDPSNRLLLTAEEAGMINIGVDGAVRHISESGWTKLSDYIAASLNVIINAKNQGVSIASPVMLHTYVEPVVRRAGVKLISPDAWLFKAMTLYQINLQDDRQAITSELFRRLRKLLLSFDQNSGNQNAIPKVHVFDAQTASLIPADPSHTGESGDWVNEIHPSKRGYRKLAQVMCPWIETVMHSYPAGQAYLTPVIN